MKWDPKRSGLVNEVIDEVVELIEAELITTELRPAIFYDLGENFDKKFRLFYMISFGREGRPKWAQKMFPATENDPTGWESFIYKVQQRVSVSNSKRKGIKLNNQEMEVVMNAKQDYVLGTSLEEVIDTLKELGLGEEKAQKLFKTYIREKEAIPAVEKQDLKEAAELFFDGELNKEEVKELIGYEVDDPRIAKYFAKTDQKVNDLEKRIKKIKKEFNLSLLKFEKGLLFESLAGTYLVYKNGREKINSQERKKVTYKDFSGQKHKEVYLDFYVNSGIDHIYEIKWKNNIQGILNSILPQIYAVAKEKKSIPKATIICNEEAPGVIVNQSSEANLIDKWSLMDLNWKYVDLEDRSILFETECQCPNIGIKDLFEYVTFEQLIKGDEYEKQFKETLNSVRTLVEIEDLGLIRNYSKALQRIYENGESIIPKIEWVTKKINSGEEITKEDMNLLGEAKKNLEETISTIHRANIINGVNKKHNHRDLISIYNIAFEEDKKELDEDMIEKLTSLDKNKFEIATRDYFVQRESRLKTRKTDIDFQTNRADIAVRELTKKYQGEGQLISELFETSKKMNEESISGKNLENMINTINKQAQFIRGGSYKSLKVSENLLGIINQGEKKYKSRAGALKKLQKEIDVAEKLGEEYVSEFNELDLSDVRAVKEFKDKYVKKFNDLYEQPIIKIINTLSEEIMDKNKSGDDVTEKEQEMITYQAKLFSPTFQLPVHYLPKIAKIMDIMTMKGEYHLNKFIELFKGIKNSLKRPAMDEDRKNTHYEIIEIEDAFSTAVAIYSSALKTHQNTITSTYQLLKKEEYIQREIQEVALIPREDIRRVTNKTLNYDLETFYFKVDSLTKSLDKDNLNETIKAIELETEKLGISISQRTHEIAHTIAETNYKENKEDKVVRLLKDIGKEINSPELSDMLKELRKTGQLIIREREEASKIDKYIGILVEKKEDLYSEIQSNNLVAQRMMNSYIEATAVYSRIISLTNKEAAVDYIKSKINVEEFKKIFTNEESETIENRLEDFTAKNTEDLTKRFRKYDIDFLELVPEM